MNPRIIFHTNIDCCQHLVHRLNDASSILSLGRVPVVGERIEILNTSKRRLSLEVCAVNFKPMALDYEKRPAPLVEIELHLDFYWKNSGTIDNKPWHDRLAEFIKEA